MERRERDGRPFCNIICEEIYLQENREEMESRQEKHAAP